jgi:NhaP-type Na+/H+ or K+/H+ antiporter
MTAKLGDAARVDRWLGFEPAHRAHDRTAAPQPDRRLTLAAATGGCALASRWHVSGPFAMVVVGLIVGTVGDAGDRATPPGPR